MDLCGWSVFVVCRHGMGDAECHKRKMVPFHSLAFLEQREGLKGSQASGAPLEYWLQGRVSRGKQNNNIF